MFYLIIKRTTTENPVTTNFTGMRILYTFLFTNSYSCKDLQTLLKPHIENHTSTTLKTPFNITIEIIYGTHIIIRHDQDPNTSFQISKNSFSQLINDWQAAQNTSWQQLIIEFDGEHCTIKTVATHDQQLTASLIATHHNKYYYVRMRHEIPGVAPLYIINSNLPGLAHLYYLLFEIICIVRNWNEKTDRRHQLNGAFHGIDFTYINDDLLKIEGRYENAPIELIIKTAVVFDLLERWKAVENIWDRYKTYDHAYQKVVLIYDSTQQKINWILEPEVPETPISRYRLHLAQIPPLHAPLFYLIVEKQGTNEIVSSNFVGMEKLYRFLTQNSYTPEELQQQTHQRFVNISHAIVLRFDLKRLVASLAKPLPNESEYYYPGPCYENIEFSLETFWHILKSWEQIKTTPWQQLIIEFDGFSHVKLTALPQIDTSLRDQLVTEYKNKYYYTVVHHDAHLPTFDPCIFAHPAINCNYPGLERIYCYFLEPCRDELIIALMTGFERYFNATKGSHSGFEILPNDQVNIYGDEAEDPILTLNKYAFLDLYERWKAIDALRWQHGILTPIYLKIALMYDGEKLDYILEPKIPLDGSERTTTGLIKKEAKTPTD